MVTNKVGVIGGGQLARMMIPPAVELGIDIRVLEEAEGMSADLAAVGIGDYRDLDTVLAFARTVDVVTFDHEHVPLAILRELTGNGIPVHPGPDALLYAQDKLQMRAKLSDLGLPVPDWAAVESVDELGMFLADHGSRAIVKKARGGYDGKGVRVVSESIGADDWFLAVSEEGRGGALLAEEFVEFRRELAQLVARRPSGEIVVWPVVETVQRSGVCVEVVAPAPGSAGRVERICADIARQIADSLGVTGVLAVEFFEATDGRVLINELAMRPHNSGHWSIEGAVTSQFEQHLRAVLDLPLGSAALRAEWAVMVNILGGPLGGALHDCYPAALAAHPEAKFHGYGKAPRPGRKVGHVTVVGDDLDDVVYRARAAASFFAG